MNKVIAIITGPSAVGKTTVAKELLRRLPNFRSTVTYTTRDKRDWSKEDKVINYVSPEKFKELVEHDQLIEWAEVYGNFYGTGKRELIETLKNNSVILNIDVQGAKSIKKQFPEAITIFIKPENLSELKNRIWARPISEQAKQERFMASQNELAQEKAFDYQIINRQNQLEDTIDQIYQILK